MGETHDEEEGKKDKLSKKELNQVAEAGNDFMDQNSESITNDPQNGSWEQEAQGNPEEGTNWDQNDSDQESQERPDANFGKFEEWDSNDGRGLVLVSSLFE